MATSPFACAGLLIGSFIVGGVCQAAWFAHPFSRRLAWPLDGGRMVRGRRIFGDNKTTRGFFIIVPATAVAMAALGTMAQRAHLAVWPLSFSEFALLGATSALGLMLGELPNSFIKRQLDIEPGRPPRHRIGRLISAIGDRLDSIVGALLGAALVVDMSWGTVVWCFVLGAPIHALFSALLYVLGVKKRMG